MSSSIFNFRESLRIIGVGLALFLAFNAILLLFGDKIPEGPLQSGAELNQENLESFFRSGHAEKTIITGSSLSARLPVDAFTGGAASLTQIGGTALTGLDAILADQAHPRTIFVEMNYIWRLPDEADVQDIRHKAVLEKWIPSLQVRFRPVNLALTLVKLIRDSLRVVPADSGFNESLYNDAVATAVARNSAQMDQLQLEHTIAKTKAAIDRLERGGSNVILLEMPVDPRLRQATRVRQVFDTALRILPENRYRWFRPPNGIFYQTIDGEHMLRAPARKYSLTIAALR